MSCILTPSHTPQPIENKKIFMLFIRPFIISVLICGPLLDAQAAVAIIHSDSTYRYSSETSSSIAQQAVTHFKNAGGIILPNPTATPQKSKNLSLQEAILLALRNNPNVISAELQRVLDKFSLEVAHNAFIPQFNVEGSTYFTDNERPSYSIGPSISWHTPIGTDLRATYNNAFAGSNGETTITLTQPLLKDSGWVYNTIALHDALDNEAIARLAFKAAVTSAVVTVINNYRLLVQDYNQLGIQQRNLHNAKETVAQYKLRYQSGQESKSDLLQQEANYATKELAITQQHDQIYYDYLQLLRALGLSSQSKISIDKDINFKLVQLPPLLRLIDKALANNIEYQSAITRLQTTKRAVIAAKNQARWQLDVTASTSIGLFTGSHTIPQNTSGGLAGNVQAPGTGPSIGFTLNFPLSNIQAKQSVVQAKIGLVQAQLSLQQQKDLLISALTHQYSAIANQQQQIKLAQYAVQLQEKTVSDAKIKLKYGKTTVFEVNQLQNNLLSEKINLVGTKIAYLNAITRLDQSLGNTLNKWGIKLRY